MRWYSVAVVWLSLSGIGSVLAQGTSVPPALEGWQTWVLDGREYVGCPFLDGVQGASSIDVPSALLNSIGSTGARRFPLRNALWLVSARSPRLSVAE